MRHNYEAIGGRSPLTDITLAQAEALRARLGPTSPSPSACATGSRSSRTRSRICAAAGATRVDRHPAGAAVLDAERAEIHRRRDRARCRPACSSSRCTSFATHPLLLRGVRRARARRAAARGRGASCSPRTVCRPASSRAATVRRGSGGDRARRRRAQPASAELRTSPIRAPAGRPSRGSAPTSSELIARARRRAAPVPRRPDRVRVRPYRDPVRHRRPGRGSGARVRGATLRRTESLNTSPTFIAMLEDLVRASGYEPRAGRPQASAMRAARRHDVLTRSSSAAASPGSRPPTSCTQRDSRSSSSSARRAPAASS